MPKLNLEFCVIDELRTDARLSQLEKYTPSKEEFVGIRKFAEGHDESGIVKVFLDNKEYVVCNQVYDYRNGSEPTLLVIFNAEVVWSDDEKYFNAEPDHIISLNINQDSVIKVPIQHAYFRHITWEEELDDLLDLLDEANELIDEYFSSFNDEDGDDECEIHIY